MSKNEEAKAQAVPGLKRHALQAADELSKYAAAPFFPDTERRGIVRSTTPEWWDGLAEAIELAQPLIKRALDDEQDLAAAHQSSTEAHAMRLFSPMYLAPLDGTPVLLYMPTTSNKFAVGVWNGSIDSLEGCWGDEEGNYYMHEPVAFMALSHLERYTVPQPTAPSEQRNRDAEMAASLLEEAAKLIELIPPVILANLPLFRWPLCDELVGAALILRDGIRSTGGEP